MSKNSPFSVLLSLYAKENPQHLDEALTSIWHHQILKPKQIVLVIDGPIPNSLSSSIEEWQTTLANKFTVVPLLKNVGLAAALNEGLKHCQHELVARMDTDDVSMPERFAKQVCFMQNSPNIVAASSQIEEWDESLTQLINTRSLPTDPQALAKFAQRRSPLSHPAAIFRKTIIQKVGGYPALNRAQDYGLWALLLKNNYQLANLPDTLLKMRAGSGLLKRRGLDYYRHEYHLLRYQKEIGFLSNTQFVINLTARGIARLPMVQGMVYGLRR